jgi:hypothetical protein
MKIRMMDKYQFPLIEDCDIVLFVISVCLT